MNRNLLRASLQILVESDFSICFQIFRTVAALSATIPCTVNAHAVELGQPFRSEGTENHAFYKCSQHSAEFELMTDWLQRVPLGFAMAECPPSSKDLRCLDLDQRSSAKRYASAMRSQLNQAQQLSLGNCRHRLVAFKRRTYLVYLAWKCK